MPSHRPHNAPTPVLPKQSPAGSAGTKCLASELSLQPPRDSTGPVRTAGGPPRARWARHATGTGRRPRGPTDWLGYDLPVTGLAAPQKLFHRRTVRAGRLSGIEEQGPGRPGSKPSAARTIGCSVSHGAEGFINQCRISQCRARELSPLVRPQVRPGFHVGARRSIQHGYGCKTRRGAPSRTGRARAPTGVPARPGGAPRPDPGTSGDGEAAPGAQPLAYWPGRCPAHIHSQPPGAPGLPATAVRSDGCEAPFNEERPAGPVPA